MCITLQSQLNLNKGHFSVVTRLRFLLQRTNVSTEHCAYHSFRIGAATTAAEAGLPPWLVQTLGRWSRNCFTLYTRTPTLFFREYKPLSLHDYQDTGYLKPTGWTVHSCTHQIICIFRKYLGANLGAHLPRSVAHSRLGGILNPP